MKREGRWTHMLVEMDKEHEGFAEDVYAWLEERDVSAYRQIRLDSERTMALYEVQLSADLDEDQQEQIRQGMVDFVTQRGYRARILKLQGSLESQIL